MTTIAEFGVRVDSNDVVQAAANLDALTDAIKRGEAAARETSIAWSSILVTLQDSALQTSQHVQAVSASQAELAQQMVALASVVTLASGSVQAAVGNLAALQAGATQTRGSLLEMAGSFNTSADFVKNAKGAIDGFGLSMPPLSPGLIAIGTAASAAGAALGVLAYGYTQGSKEAQAYNQALVMTGNYAGTSTAALSDMAVRVGAANGSVGEAASVLTQLAGTGQLAEGSFESIANAALAMEEATGKSIESTVAEFVRIAQDPVSAAKALDDQYHFLTASTYTQIAALQQQGDEIGATQLLTETFAQTLQTRAGSIVSHLNVVELRWNAIKRAAAGALDAIVDIGRQDTLAQQIATLETKLATPTAYSSIPIAFDDNPNLMARNTTREEDEEKLRLLRLQQKERDETTRRAAEAARRERQELEEAQQRAQEALNAPPRPPRLTAVVASVPRTDVSTSPPLLPPNAPAKAPSDTPKETSAEASQVFIEQLERQRKALERSGELAAKALGLGERQSNVQAQTEAATTRFDEERDKLGAKRRASPQQYDEHTYRTDLAALDKAETAYKETVLANYEAMNEARGDWRRGASSAFQSYLEHAQDVAGQTKTLFTNAFSSMENAVVTFAMTGKFSFTDFTRSILSDMARVAAQQAASGLLSGIASLATTAISAWAGGGSAGAGSSVGSAAGSDNDIFSLANASSGMTYGSRVFSAGGYTGPGNKYDPAGIVHAGEFVLRREVVSQPGMRNYLDHLNARGYADGGLVTPLAAARPAIGGAAGMAIHVSTTVNVADSGAGDPGKGLDQQALQQNMEKQMKAAADRAVADSWRPGGVSHRNTLGRR